MTTLVDHLRGLSDEALAGLLRHRPDLVVPVPADLAGLAARAQSRVSLARALDGLDEFTLRILDAARLTADPDRGTTTEAAILDLVPAGLRDAARSALDRLRDLALLYGPTGALRPVGGLAEVCPPYPAGLGRPAAELDPAAAALHADPAGLRRALLAAPPAARAVLDRLAAGPPVGTVAPATLADPAAAAAAEGDAADPGGAVNPVRWLIARRLLVPVRSAGATVPTGGPAASRSSTARAAGGAASRARRSPAGSAC
ncbi:MAG TPA: hypothetical protein VNV66_14845, partial [Pilimelia sp.]|nr:hypothetical protein [Pilimelia sp.]